MESVPFEVLVVDDDLDMLSLTQVVLRSLIVDGRTLRLTSCESAAEARTLLAGTTFALVITDVEMEEAGAGLELVRNLSGDARHVDTAVVVRTGRGGSWHNDGTSTGLAISALWFKEELSPSQMRFSVAGLLRAHQAVVDLRRRTREVELMLSESHRRSQNKLQVVASLLRLHLCDVEDQGVRELLQLFLLQIQSIGLSNDYVCLRPHGASFDLGAYLARLSELVLAAAPGSTTLTREVAPVHIPVESAIPVGLIATVLLMNAVANCVPDRASSSSGTIRLALDRVGEWVRLSVSDGGGGDSLRQARSGSRGLQIAQGLAKQLHGTLTYEVEPTSRVTLVFAVEGASVPSPPTVSAMPS